ncbi:GDSL esterase/lipase [Panicum miliaceum]|uniref:GDSL esterase/lipase n=1 Tax=Panicum miliaceum TaxID=4540 RepID=A0A3L6PG12_PANMI|nr:GDSL esterase/lipase [Panicum miliaceum]
MFPFSRAHAPPKPANRIGLTFRLPRFRSASAPRQPTAAKLQNAGNTIPLSKQVEYFGATKAKMVAAVGPRAANAQL